MAKSPLSLPIYEWDINIYLRTARLPDVSARVSDIIIDRTYYIFPVGTKIVLDTGENYYVTAPFKTITTWVWSPGNYRISFSQNLNGKITHFTGTATVQPDWKSSQQDLRAVYQAYEINANIQKVTHPIRWEISLEYIFWNAPWVLPQYIVLPPNTVITLKNSQWNFRVVWDNFRVKIVSLQGDFTLDVVYYVSEDGKKKQIKGKVRVTSDNTHAGMIQTIIWS